MNTVTDNDFLIVVVVSCAVYNAVGLAAYELFDNVDFDQWFKNQLLGELQVSHHRYCVGSVVFLLKLSRCSSFGCDILYFTVS